MSDYSVKEEVSRWTVLYMYATCESFEKIIDTEMLKISLTKDVNDPMESIPQTGDGKLRTFQINRIRNALLPYFCFSKSITHPMLWGHYAEKNRGVVLAFLFPISKNSNTSAEEYEKITEDQADEEGLTDLGFESSEWRDVTYSENRVAYSKIYDNEKRLIYTKSDEWKYEEEVRCVCPYESADECKGGRLFYKWPLRYLAGVIIGAECNYTKGYIVRKLNSQKCNNILKKKQILKDFIVSKAKENDYLYSYHVCPWMNGMDGKKFLEACEFSHSIQMLKEDVLGDEYKAKLKKLFVPKQLQWSDWSEILKNSSLEKIVGAVHERKNKQIDRLAELGLCEERLKTIRRSEEKCSMCRKK